MDSVIDDFNKSLVIDRTNNPGASNLNNPSAQTQVLENTDLLQEIFYCLPTTLPESRTWNKHLLSISLTCKAFLEPALNVLWEELPPHRWIHLISLISSVSLQGNRLIANDVLSDQSLHRFDYYAQRIKNIHMTTSAFNAMSFDIASCIIVSRQFNAFPALRSLRWTCDVVPTELNASSLVVLASQPLTTLSIQEECDPEPSNMFFVYSLMTIISIRSPDLTHLDLRGEIVESAANLLPKFERIKRLSLLAPYCQDANIIKDILWHTNTLNDLTELDISVLFWMQRPTGMTIELAALKTLGLYGPLAFIDYFFSVVTAPQVTLLDIIISTYETRGQSESFRWIDQIAMLAPSVQYVIASSDLHAMENSDSPHNRHKLPSSLFFGMLACKRLAHINASLVLEEKDILSLVNSGKQWPLIKEIDLHGEEGRLGVLPCLLSQIDLFAEAFPNLKKLSMAVSFRMEPSEIERMHERIRGNHPCHKLESLTLRSAVKQLSQEVHAPEYIERCKEEFGPLTVNESIEKVASQFIDHVFPHLLHFSIDEIFYLDEGLRTALESMVRDRINGARDHICPLAT
ncbi:hypothetical protein JR316_0005229 [Psilocybe cubensis]|uniref:Uncharacterized protein n=2 Tax=Psilocybe cubensis TaxID=181762 RepID=A0ACB8H5D0_PSICU|nr:hypothetical protein JR316_0005229 [Psilocybe cubensis]KAH9483128.1 hypothetical protein JR316_0005229 [Psilocybe cubensis]